MQLISSRSGIDGFCAMWILCGLGISIMCKQGSLQEMMFSSETSVTEHLRIGWQMAWNSNFGDKQQQEDGQDALTSYKIASNTLNDTSASKGLSDLGDVQDLEKSFSSVVEEVAIAVTETSSFLDVDLLAMEEELLNNACHCNCFCLDNENIAKFKPATQSSTEGSHVAGRAVDDNYFTALEANSCSSTVATGERNPWWQVDLAASYKIGLVRLHSSDYSDHPDGLHDITVSILDANGIHVQSKHHPGIVKPGVTRDFRFEARGNFVKIQLYDASGVLSLSEVEVFPYKCQA